MSVKDAVAETMTVRGLGWWLVAGGVLTATIVYPIAAGANLCVDDFVWILINHSEASILGALRSGWRAYPFFRLFDIGANSLIDVRTLAIWPIILIQGTAFLCLAQAMRRLMMLWAIPSAVPWLAAVTWLLMQPATQLSMWSAGTLSQTMCAAAGLWLVVLILEAAKHPGRRQPTGRLLGVSCVGILAKELFVGWATCGAVLLAVVAWQATTQQSPRRIRSWLQISAATLPQLAAVLTPAIVFVVARLMTSRLSVVGAGETGTRYSFHGPEAVATNVALALVGMFAQGPVHWARFLDFPWNAVPFLGAGSSFLVARYGSRHLRCELGSAKGVLDKPLAYTVGLGLCSVWPALLIGHFSELYVMGANALVAVLVGIGVSAALTNSGGSRRGRIMAAFGTVLCVMYAIAATGAISRAYHFGVTWSHARAIRKSVREVLERTPGVAVIAFTVPESLRSGPTHSKYINPPVVAANPPRAFALQKRADPASGEAIFDWPVAPPEYKGQPIIPDPPLVQREMW